VELALQVVEEAERRGVSVSRFIEQAVAERLSKARGTNGNQDIASRTRVKQELESA